MSGLLHIEDPARPRGRTVGIDLGTTNSLVATVDNGTLRVLPMEADGSPLLASIVHYAADGKVTVGREAATHLADDPTNTLRSVKRFMGKVLADVPDHQAYNFAASPGLVRFLVADGQPVSPIEASAEILRHLRKRAEAHFSEKIERAVVTVPAYFDESQRQGTISAARLAGLEVLRLLSEPTAAALAYGLDTGAQGHYAVFDLGGGTFDVSVLKLKDSVFQVMAVGGDTQLGGDDFDRAIVNGILGTAAVATLAAPPFAASMAAARAAKEALTTNESVTMKILDREEAVTRSDFERWIAPILLRIEEVLRNTVRDAELEPTGLQGVILVGGSTRVPAIRALAASVFGRAPITDLDPDQVVAMGAARQAALLADEDHSSNALLLDVIPLSLGLEAMGGVAEKIVERNSPIPIRRAQTFTTFEDGQTGMDIHVVQGEREFVADCRSLARFRLTGIPPGPAGAARVQVTFEVDANGLLSVSAHELASGKSQRVQVQPSAGLTDLEVESMLLASLDNAEGDIQRRRIADLQVEAMRLASGARRQLEIHSEKADARELTVIRARLDALEAALIAPIEADRLREALRAVEEASAPLAERLMNEVVARAAVGRRVEDF